MSSDSEWGWSGPNPIASCALLVLFGGFFTDIQLEAVREMHGSIRSDFPKRSDRRTMQLQLAFGNQFPQPRDQLGGVAFERYLSDGRQAESFVVSRDNFSYQISEYTRWVAVGGKAQNLFERACEAVGEVPPITGLVMEYLDRFVWNGALDDVNYASLLNSQSNSIAHQGAATSRLWHSHHGFYSEIGNQFRLDNINVDVMNESVDGELSSDSSDSRRVVYVRINHRLDISPPLIHVTAQKRNTRVAELFGATHLENKRLLRDVLNAEIVARIPGLSQDH